MARRSSGVAAIALGVYLAGGALAHAQPAPAISAAVVAAASAPIASTSTPVAPAPAPPDPRYASLPELAFYSINTRATLHVRVYRPDGTLDPDALARLAHLLRDTSTGTDSPVVPRTLQLLVRVATHFNAARVEVVSGYRSGMRPDGRRARREGYHGVGSAIDFRVPGVEPVRVAAYARTFAHVGVGYYPREGFVHLDSREQSFFWENGARRGRRGWNRPLDREGVAAREAGWTPADDAPWDPPGAPVALVLHPRTQPGAHRPHRHASRHGRRHRGRARPPLHVFRGAAEPSVAQ